LIEHLQTTPLLQYTGSLTTPPCAEGLTFLVAQQPLDLGVETYNAIKAVVKFNSRYTQAALGTENLLAVSAANSAKRTGDEQAVESTPVEQKEAVANPTGPTTIHVTEVAVGMKVVPTSIIAVAVNPENLKI
jgi:hypothetical protein